MTREQLEHAIRAACRVSGEPELVVIGSQAILGPHPDAPAALTASIEVDVFPRGDPSKSDVIDAQLGELSPFHTAFGFYVHGVDPATAILPDGWERRVIAVPAGASGEAFTGWAIEPHDLAVSKLLAFRDKDAQFVAAMLELGIVRGVTLRERLRQVPSDHPQVVGTEKLVIAARGLDAIIERERRRRTSA